MFRVFGGFLKVIISQYTSQSTSFFKVTWIDSPNGGHVFSPEKVTAMGPFTRSRLEEPGICSHNYSSYPP